MPKTTTPRGVGDGQADGNTEQTATPAKPDWETIGRDFRAGVLSIREIARRHKLSDTAVRKHAKEEGWERDLTARVQEKVRTDLVRAEVRAANARANPQTEREIVEQAAATVVEIVKHHRRDIRRGHSIVGRLFDQLELVADKREELEALIIADTETEIEADGARVIQIDSKRRAALMAAVSLPEHANTARSLSMAMKNLVALERQAHAIVASPADPPPDDGEDNEKDPSLEAFVARLDNVLTARRDAIAQPAAAPPPA